MQLAARIVRLPSPSSSDEGTVGTWAINPSRAPSFSPTLPPGLGMLFQPITFPVNNVRSSLRFLFQLHRWSVRRIDSLEEQKGVFPPFQSQHRVQTLPSA